MDYPGCNIGLDGVESYPFSILVEFSMDDLGIVIASALLGSDLGSLSHPKTVLVALKFVIRYLESIKSSFTAKLENRD